MSIDVELLRWEQTEVQYSSICRTSCEKARKLGHVANVKSSQCKIWSNVTIGYDFLHLFERKHIAVCYSRIGLVIPADSCLGGKTSFWMTTADFSWDTSNVHLLDQITRSPNAFRGAVISSIENNLE